MPNRTSRLTLAVAAALLAAPSTSRAQPGVPSLGTVRYQFDYAPTIPGITGLARLAVETPVSTTGCGTYLCLTISAGRSLDPDYFGAEFDVTHVHFTDAARALGATALTWDVDGHANYITCFGPDFIRCDQDDYAGVFNGIDEEFDRARRGLGYATGAYAVASEAPADTYIYTEIGAVTFAAYFGNGADPVTETIAPRIEVDGVAIGVTPEPAPLALAGAGVLLLGAWARRRVA